MEAVIMMILCSKVVELWYSSEGEGQMVMAVMAEPHGSMCVMDVIKDVITDVNSHFSRRKKTFLSAPTRYDIIAHIFISILGKLFLSNAARELIIAHRNLIY